MSTTSDSAPSIVLIDVVEFICSLNICITRNCSCKIIENGSYYVKLLIFCTVIDQGFFLYRAFKRLGTGVI